MKTLIVLSLLAGTSTPALAEWIKVGSTDNLDHYADPSTIRRKGNMVKMWSMFNYKAPRMGPEGTYLSDRDQTMYDCAKEQYKLLVEIRYSGRMGLGRVVDTGTFSDDDWRPVSPGSAGEAHWEAACGKTKLE